MKSLKMPTQDISVQAHNAPGAALELETTRHRTTCYSIGVRMLC